MTVAAVVPTFRRREALLERLPGLLAMQGIDELVIVDDGSDDGTADAVEALHLPRVRVVRHGNNRGLPAARNTGADSSTADWIVYLEDDCGFPADYATALLAVATELGADIVGAPWLSGETNLSARAAPQNPVPAVGLLSPPWVHPVTPLETPFLPALALVRRSVFERVRYDEGYRGNFYREETDFFVSARRAGFRVMLTPTTASWQEGRWDGGCRLRSAVRYDAYVAKNTWRFLRKHGQWLRNEGLLDESSAMVEARVVYPLLRQNLKRPLLTVRDRWLRR